MIALAWPSLRYRLPSFVATFVTIFFSALLIGSFASLVETATSAIPEPDQETLVIVGSVIGSWGALIALFSVVSTLSVTVRRRSAEIGLLRTLGATPRQARRLIRTETGVVAVIASLAGVTLAWPAGAGLLDLLRNGGLISDSVPFAGGIISAAAAAGAVVLTSVLAASLAGRAASRGPVRLAVARDAGPPHAPRWRAGVGVLLLSSAIAAGVVTVTITAQLDDPYAAMQSSGSASIVAGVGLAALAPWLLGVAAALVRPLLEHTGAPGYLAGVHAQRRAALLSGVLGPTIVFTAASTGTLMLVGIDSRTLVLSPEITATQADTLTLINNVVVGMIALFAALMVLNSLLAGVGDRRAEFDRIRLVGGTTAQVRAVVLAETLLIAVIGVIAGLIASLATIVPFAYARGEGLVPQGQLWLPLVVGAAAVLLTVAGGQIAVLYTTRTEPVRPGRSTGRQ